MFIRKTKKIDPTTGREYFLFQLIESVRTERGPRQNIILNLGSDLQLDPAEAKLLALRIEEIITGQQSFLPVEEKIDHLAKHFAEKIIAKRMQPKLPINKVFKALDGTDFQMIDINSIEHENARTIGVEHLLVHSAEQLKLKDALRASGLSDEKAAVALGSICARAIAPNSEKASLEWLQNTSGLGELLGHNFHDTSLTQFYRISDTILKYKDDLEKHIVAVQNERFRRTNSIVLYDLTNTYMEGQALSNPKAHYGHSKEKRSDSPLITLGLAVDEHGFLLKSKFLPGNVSEPTSLKEAIEVLLDPEQLIRPTVLIDSGIATEENLRWLNENRFTYIVSARQDAPFPRTEEELEIVNSSGVRAAILRSELVEDLWLYCESPAKEATASQMKSSFQKKFEEDLEKIRKCLVSKRGRKNYLKIIERIGRLKEKHKRISDCYEIIVHPSPDGKTAVNCTWNRIEEKLENKLTGSYYLRTNIFNRDAKQLWTLYQTIRTVEDAFRFMKSSLGMRPVFHQKEERVDGHLWITVLAYTLIHNLLYQLRQQDVRLEWETIHTRMQNRVRVTMQAKTKEGKILRVRTTTKPEAAQVQIYEKLQIPSSILRAIKSII
jgi:transposase